MIKSCNVQLLLSVDACSSHVGLQATGYVSLQIYIPISGGISDHVSDWELGKADIVGLTGHAV